MGTQDETAAKGRRRRLALTVLSVLLWLLGLAIVLWEPVYHAPDVGPGWLDAPPGSGR